MQEYMRQWGCAVIQQYFVCTLITKYHDSTLRQPYGGKENKIFTYICTAHTETVVWAYINTSAKFLLRGSPKIGYLKIRLRPLYNIAVFMGLSFRGNIKHLPFVLTKPNLT